MNQYQIIRWDVIKNDYTKTPVIYIKPDSKLLEFAASNSNAVMIKVSGTGTEYDGNEIPATLDKSNAISHNECDYFERTGNYILTLHSNWYGYPHPKKLGTLLVVGMVVDTKETYIKTTKQKQKKIVEAYKSGRMKSPGLISSIGGLGVILLILFLLTKRK